MNDNFFSGCTNNEFRLWRDEYSNTHFVSLFTLFVLLFFNSCTKDIKIDLPDPKPKIVVDGRIENGDKPVVILTRNAGYFQPVDSNTLINSIITNALVTVSDGIVTDTLKLQLDLTSIIPLVYKGAITGQAGKTYTLTVVADGKTLTSTTTIPNPVPLDSIWFKLQPPNDSLGFIWAHLTDPPGRGNAYRWFAKRIGKDAYYIPPLGSAFDDKFIDGKSFDFAYNRGIAPNSSATDDNNKEAGFFKKGDSVSVKFCTISEDAFYFFRAYEAQVFNNGNPFASPQPIPTNIYPQDDALGFWCGYGTSIAGVRLIPK